MRISFVQAGLLAPLFGLLGAGCPPAGPDHTAERLACLRSCAAQKDGCILSAQVATEIQRCDAQNQACVAPCPY